MLANNVSTPATLSLTPSQQSQLQQLVHAIFIEITLLKHENLARAPMCRVSMITLFKTVAPMPPCNIPHYIDIITHMTPMQAIEHVLHQVISKILMRNCLFNLSNQQPMQQQQQQVAQQQNSNSSNLIALLAVSRITAHNPEAFKLVHGNQCDKNLVYLFPLTSDGTWCCLMTSKQLINVLKQHLVTLMQQQQALVMQQQQQQQQQQQDVAHLAMNSMIIKELQEELNKYEQYNNSIENGNNYALVVIDEQSFAGMNINSNNGSSNNVNVNSQQQQQQQQMIVNSATNSNSQQVQQTVQIQQQAMQQLQQPGSLLSMPTTQQFQNQQLQLLQQLPPLFHTIICVGTIYKTIVIPMYAKTVATLMSKALEVFPTLANYVYELEIRKFVILQQSQQQQANQGHVVQQQQASQTATATVLTDILLQTSNSIKNFDVIFVKILHQRATPVVVPVVTATSTVLPIQQ